VLKNYVYDLIGLLIGHDYVDPVMYRVQLIEADLLPRSP
jgi:hypothetical protein